MKNNLKNLILLLFPYFIVIFLLAVSTFNNGTELSIDVLYQNMGFFAVYLFASNILIFSDNKKNLNNKNYFIYILKKIIIDNLIMVLFLMIFNWIIFMLFNFYIEFPQILSFSVQLFAILIIVSLFIITIDFNNNNLSKNYIYKYMFLIFFYFLYVLEYSYGNNIILLNIYKYYFYKAKIQIIIAHYLFWFFIPFIIIYFKYLKNKKSKKILNII